MRRFIIGLLLLLLATAGSLCFNYSLLLVHYHYSYYHATWLSDEDRRLPLWYPYEIVDEHGRTEMQDWRSHADPLRYSVHVWEGMTEREKDLQRLRRITTFQYTTNVVWGVRDVYLEGSNCIGTGAATRDSLYFLFASDMERVAYFDKKDAFVSACRSYGVFADDQSDFTTLFERFKECCSSPTIDELLSFLSRQPLDGGEMRWMIVWILGGVAGVAAGLWMICAELSDCRVCKKEFGV